MSLDAALNAAISGLRINQAHVQLVSSNVAHANDPSYTKKTLSRETVFLGNNQAGGVSIAGYQAAINASLRRQFETLTSASGLTSTQQEYLGRIQNLLGASSDTAALPQLFNQFTAAWQSLQSQPESAAAQQQVIALGEQLAAEVRRLSAGIDQIDADIRRDLDAATDELNDKLAKVFELNLRIKASDPNGVERLDLIDQRDAIVREIANLVDVRSVERENGAIALFTPAGLSLLDGAPARFDFDGTNIISVDSGAPVNGLLREGKIKALLNLRYDGTAAGQPASADPASEVIRKLRSQLDMVVSAFTTTTGSPVTFAAAYNNGVGSLRVSASHLTTVQPGATTPQMGTVTFSGSLVEGDVFEITIKGKTFSYTATQNDTSFDQIAQKLAAIINSDSTLGVSAINGVASLQLIGTSNNTPFTVVTSVNGQLPELTQGFFVNADRYTFTVNTELLAGRQQLKKNSAADVVTALNSNDRNFIAVGLSLTNVSYKGLMSGIIGASSSNAKIVSDNAKLNAETLRMTEQRYQEETGVNLDEELANLQLLQNAYAASARLMTVIQTLFDTLQAAVSR
ncbi:flagellar hook-associated protein FlgK [Dongia deserti]|uniref:flagellar hook-associated protein FlgK n=1 Tax=Dongia deserti TaxID=2268030 RepID=UPI000E654F23|nr:flagellar basal body rod C-terminal domain-containing protein [Dongia deserti]